MSFLTGGYTIAACFAIAYGAWLVWQEPSNIRTIVKTLAIGSLALLSYRLGGPLMLTVALALSALGDAFLANEGDRNFLFGLGAFLLAHFAYTALFVLHNQIPDAMSPSGYHGGAAILLTVLALIILRRLWPHLGAMQLPVSFYVFAILVMAIAAATMQRQVLVLVGAALFMTSDAILAHEHFVWKKGSAIRRFSPYLIWGFYWTGQALIAWSWLSKLPDM